MIERYMFMAYPNEKLSILNNSDAENISIFYYNDLAFLYYESKNGYINPYEIVSGNVKTYPNGQHWQQGVKIFSYGVPMNEKQWLRKIENKKPYIKINYLKPEMFASYVYKHYELQGSGCGCDKYGIIFSFGNMLVFYKENPVEKSTEQDTKKNNNIEDIQQHFMDNLKWIIVD